MELNLGIQKIERSADFEEEFFGMGDLAVVMTILRSKLYSNPIRTIVQEILSNARDAHREVNKADIPVQVLLPSVLNPTFEVKDFGPGISPQRMSDVFLLYGNSTKREDNTQTGGFGLGAKSPFSYTDSFVIETTTEGQKRTYVAYIDESHIGKLSLLSTEKAPGKETGTAIKIPARKEDFLEFSNNFYSVTAYWDILPEVEEPDLFPDVSEYKQRVSRVWYEFHTGLKILLDKIPYFISSQNLGEVDVEKYGISREKIRALFEIGVCIEYLCGELTVSANREQIELSESNLQIIFKHLDEAWGNLPVQMQKELDLQPDYFAAARYLRTHKLRHGEITDNWDTDFYYKENKIPSSLDYSHKRIHKIPGLQLQSFYFFRTTPIKFIYKNFFFSVNIHNPLSIIVVDDPYRVNKKIDQFRVKEEKAVLVLRPVYSEESEKFSDSKKKNLIRIVLERFLEYYGGIEKHTILYSSQLKYTPPPRQKKITNKAKRRYLKPLYISDFAWHIRYLQDLEDEIINGGEYKVFYLPTNYNWVQCGRHEYQLETFKKDMTDILSFILRDTKEKVAVFTCSSATYEKRYRDKNLHGHLFTFIREGLYKKYPRFFLNELYYLDPFYHNRRDITLPVKEVRDQFVVKNTIKNLTVKNTLEKYMELLNWWSSFLVTRIRKYEPIFPCRSEYSPFIRFVIKTYSKYPLLSDAIKSTFYDSSDKWRQAFTGKVSKYINTVDNAVKKKKGGARK